jgi:antirestriction protein ArdC
MSKKKLDKVVNEITERYIKEIEKGILKWEKMWTAYWPMNVQSKKTYNGFNAMYLQLITNEKGYEYPFYITYKGAIKLGGNVKKGQSGIQIFFWKKKEDKKNPKKIILIPYSWTVFNIDQCEKIEFEKPIALKLHDHKDFSKCRKVLDEYSGRPKVVNKENQRAYYSSKNDFVNMPAKNNFNSSEDFYQVLFHELIHSTGHHSRLNRLKKDSISSFGSTEYSKEELIAELGASFLCHHTDILNENFKNSAAYLQGWAREFKDKPSLLYSASNHAMKAVQLILGINNKEEIEKEIEEEFASVID